MGFWKFILPESGVNLNTNPSFETNTTGWAAQGTNTIARSSAQAFKGAYSLLCTYQDDLDLANYAFTPTASTTYHLSAWVHVPANWDGGNVRIGQENYTGATVTYNNIYTHGTSPTAASVYLETKIVFDADTSGNIQIEATSAPTAGRTIYLDAVQIEQNASYATTYVDGDQPGCKWNGLTHGSTSTRSAQERSGGRVVDFESDYGVRIRQQSGSGMAFSSHKSQRQALMPGAAFQGSKAEPRTLTLLATPLATSAGNLHALRDDLIDAVKPDLVSGDQEVTLRYTGANANKPVEIRAVYDSGLEFGEPAGKIENIPMRFIAYDPYWYEIGNGSAVLTTSGTLTTSMSARRVAGAWERFLIGGSTKDCRAIAITSQYIYVGGNFTNINSDANQDYIARYDKDAGTWSAMGTGMNALVWALAVGPDGSIYAGGAFTLAGGVANTDGIARWDGSAWNALGTGVSGGTGVVTALAFNQNGSLFATGDFTQMGGVANTAYIAMWNGSAWIALSTGLGGIGRALVVGVDNDLYIGGEFTNLGDANGDYIVKWNGTAFSALSTGMGNIVYALASDNAGNIYAGGTFVTAGGVSAARVAKWNGTRWFALGSGVDNNSVRSLMYNGGILYVGGDFISVGGLTLTSSFAGWNGTAWVNFDIYSTTTPVISEVEIDPYTGYLYTANDDEDAYISAVNTVTNNGTARAFPKITIKRSGGTSATLTYLKNQTTGATLWLNYALLDGETLTLDFTMGGRSAISSIFGDVWRAVLKTSDVAEFYLLPGANSIIAFVNPVGSPTVTATITWPLAHLSVDGVA